jgi:hypothetical protein
MVVVADDGVLIVLDGPLTCVQVPVPTPGCIARHRHRAGARSTGLRRHSPSWGSRFRVITTWSLLGEQEPLVIVHW